MRLSINYLAGLALLGLAGAFLAWQPESASAESVWFVPAPKQAGTALAATLIWLLVSAWLMRPRRLLVSADANWLIVYASQTGSAERLAGQTAAALRQQCPQVIVSDLRHLSATTLENASQVLFVISTTGDGEAPDGTQPVLNILEKLSLRGLRYGLLSLGDRRYTSFCGFGRAFAQQLQRTGALPLFAPIEVDNGDPAAIRQWHDDIAALNPPRDLAQALPDIAQPGFVAFALVQRKALNPQGCAEPVFHLQLRPESPELMPHWQAGDIAEIRIPDANGADVMREYSIASIPQDGAVELLVRRVPEGRGSQWLIEQRALQQPIELRIRSNRAFHAQAFAAPVLLIGNGTGIAGLRSHLKARALAGLRGAWLIFGERQREHDLHFQDELLQWQASGVLERLDLAFSRDRPGTYVQDCLQQQADRVRRFIQRGAAIYVCGSRAGMAAAVDQRLLELIGAETLQDMAEQGRYCRDVY